MTLRRALIAAALGCAVAGSAAAQTGDENRAADALAADMRLLAANPLDIEALVAAGELTLKLGDPTAAASFFTRAEKLDPNNPRIKAGWGSLLVRSERPGEALRRFREAEARGLDPRRFAADRGLAYDLIGQQERAQRDYRLVLRGGPDDEVTRRYALSLGISGRKDEALKLLDPLLERSDRAAWRSRAFVLAMTGDTQGAEKIAATMMAPGLGAGLTPFFRRLPQLSAAGRAFAVNFGELVETPARDADARLTPSLPPLGPDPDAPTPVVAAAAAPVAVADTGGKRDKRRRKNEPAVVGPGPAPAPAPAPAAVALAPPPYVAPSAPMVQPLPADRPTAAVVQRAPLPVAAPPAGGTLPARTLPPRTGPATPPAPSATVASAVTGSAPPEVVAIPGKTPPVVVAVAPAAALEPPQPGVADQPSAAEAGVPAPTATARVSEDSVLARIVANAAAMPVPAPPAAPIATPVRSPPPTPVARIELPKPKPAAAKAPPKSTHGRAEKDEILADAQPLAPRTARGSDGAAKQRDAAGATPGRDISGKPPKVAATDDAPALDKNGCPLPPAGDKRASGRRRGAVRAAPARGGAALSAKCKTTPALAKDKADSAGKSEPARIWVQVAGGANEASLEKSWQIMRDRAPDLLRGRQGWTTPLRATNRVLTGPFKSADEAQAFVNKLTKAGVPAFVFASARGQKIERLGSK